MSQSSQFVTAPTRRLRGRPLAALLFILVLVLLWTAWARIAQHRLASATAGVAAVGIVIDPPEAAREQLPPQQNAATYYKQAIAAMSPAVNSPSSSTLSFPNYPPFSPAWHQSMDAAMAAQAPALSAVRTARQFEHGDWGYARTSYNSYTLTYAMSFNQARHLANFIADAAVDAHLQGDDAEAIERIEDLLHLSKTVGENSDLIGRLVTLGIQSMALTRLEMILPDLKIAGNKDSSSTIAKGAADPLTLRRLIRELLDQRESARQARDGLIVTMRAETGSARQVRDSTYLLRPMLDLEIARMLNTRKNEWLAMDEPSWADAMKLLPSESPPPASGSYKPSPDAQPPRYSHMISETVGQPLPRYVELNFRAIAERRAAATAIAVRLYRADHDRWPQNLGEPVPAYLPAVPIDPVLGGSIPMKYVILRGALPDGGDRPMLYWGVRGNPGSPPPEPTFGYSRGVQWRDLSRWYLPAPATSQSAE
jgi:hypothetical protein